MQMGEICVFLPNDLGEAVRGGYCLPRHSGEKRKGRHFIALGTTFVVEPLMNLAEFRIRHVCIYLCR